MEIRRMTLLTLFALLPVVLAGAMLQGADSPDENGAVPGQQVARQSSIETEAGEVTVRYWLYAPKTASPDSSKQPLVLFLHGAGERGTDMELVKKWGPPQQVEGGKQLPFLLISPQCPEDERWDVEVLAKFVESLSEKLPVDRQRIYVTGLSMGGYGTWMLLAARPEMFAAGVPICGGGDAESADRLTSIPIWAFHGDEDTAVPLQRSQEMVEAIERAGGKRAKLTVYPGVGHNSWSPTYDNPEVYQWLLDQQRESD
jgi:predicted peptidase